MTFQSPIGVYAAVPAFTPDECKLIATVASDTVKAVGRGTLSAAFRESFVAWLGPNLTCDGPLPIRLPSGADIDAYNTIRAVLYAGAHPIALKERGVTVSQ